MIIGIGLWFIHWMVNKERSEEGLCHIRMKITMLLS